MSTSSTRDVTRRSPPLVGARMRFGWLRVRRRMAAAMRTAEFTELQDAHLSVFQYPGPDGMRPADVGRQTRMSRQATNHLLRQLESWGYLERRTREGDARRRVYLTGRGRDLMVTLERSVREFERELAREVGKGKFAIFVQVLQVCAAPVADATRAEARARPASPARRPRPRRSSRD